MFTSARHLRRLGSICMKAEDPELPLLPPAVRQTEAASPAGVGAMVGGTVAADALCADADDVRGSLRRAADCHSVLLPLLAGVILYSLQSYCTQWLQRPRDAVCILVSGCGERCQMVWCEEISQAETAAAFFRRNVLL